MSNSLIIFLVIWYLIGWISSYFMITSGKIFKQHKLKQIIYISILALGGMCNLLDCVVYWYMDRRS